MIKPSNRLPSIIIDTAHNNCRDRSCDNGERVCDSNITDAPIVIVKVIVKEEHHYHKGAVHLDFHNHFIANLASKLKIYLHI